MEVKRHALTAALDGGDGGLFAISGAAHFVEEPGSGVVAAVIDGQLVIGLRRHAARELEHIAHGGGQDEGAATLVAVVAARAAVVIHLERLYARRDGGRLRARRGHVDVESAVDCQCIGERWGDGDCRVGHGEGSGVVKRPVPCHCHGIAAAVRYAEAAEHIAAFGRGGQGNHVVLLGGGCTCTADSSSDVATRGCIYGDAMLRIRVDERHRQVEAGVVIGYVRIEVKRHALTAAPDGGDGGLFAISGAAHFVEELGGGVVAAVIDGQLVKALRRHAARELEHIALGGGQGEGAAAIVAVVAARAAVVIHLESGDCGIAERQHVRARARGHVHVPVSCRACGDLTVLAEGHVVCPRRGGGHGEQECGEERACRQPRSAAQPRGRGQREKVFNGFSNLHHN